MTTKSVTPVSEDLALLKDERVHMPKLYSFDEVRELLATREADLRKQLAGEVEKLKTKEVGLLPNVHNGVLVQVLKIIGKDGQEVWKFEGTIGGDPNNPFPLGKKL